MRICAMQHCGVHAGKASDHLKLSALELQMWNVLESFARWALDAPEAIQSFGETLGAAFHSRMDLQIPICRALKQLCAQTSAALRHGGEEDGAGFGLPSGAPSDLGGDPDTASVSIAVHLFEDSVPAHFTIDVAKAHRDSLRGIAHKWLQELLNRFVQLPPDRRAPIADAISSMAMVAGEAHAATFYKEALSKVISSLQVIKVRLCLLQHTDCSRCCTWWHTILDQVK
jgi:ribosomal RNA-processing protein 12